MNVTLPRMVQVIGALSAPAALAAASAAVVPDALPRAPSGRGAGLDETLPYALPGGKIGYLPVYTVASEVVGLTGGGQERRYHIKLFADGADWVLRVQLSASPSPALAGKPGMDTAKPIITGEERVSLGYSVAAATGAFRRSLDFQTIAIEASGLTASLRLSTLDRQNEVGTALIDPAALPQLTVTKIATVGVEMPFASPALAERYQQLQDEKLKRLKLAETYEQFQRTLPPDMKATVLDPLQARMVGMDGEIRGLQTALDGAEKVVRIDPVHLSLKQILSPEPFCLAQHRYAVTVRVQRTPRAIGLIQRSVAGRRYYQDADHPIRFHYLPERFGLAIKPDGAPNLRIGSTADPIRYLLTYVAVPVVDTGRMHGDMATLAAYATERIGKHVGPEDVTLEPLHGDTVDLSVTLPVGGQWVRIPRPGAIRDLLGPIDDAVTLTESELAMLYDAIFAADQSLFGGTVSIALGDWAHETVPFVAHLDARPEEVWRQVFDASVPPVLKRGIEVQADATVFKLTDALSVLFEAGENALLTPRRAGKSLQIARRIGVGGPREADDGSFRYRLDWGEGSDGEGQWRTGSGPILTITGSSLTTPR